MRWIRLFRMDMRRGLSWKRFTMIVLANTVLTIVSVWGNFDPIAGTPRSQLGEHYGVIDLLMFVQGFDVFKVVGVLLMGGLYTSSFCKDESSRYLRMILSRTNPVRYACSRILANVVCIVFASVLSMLAASMVLFVIGFPLVSWNPMPVLQNMYYENARNNHPLLFIVMMGLQSGMIVSACCSIGLLYSAYQSNTFVSVGVSAVVFFIVLSFRFFTDTPFDVLNLLAMHATLPSGNDTPEPVMFAWGMLYPALVIAACGFQFNRRMKWRTRNGII